VGSFEISVPHLERGVLNARYAKTKARIRDLPTQPISERMTHMIKGLLRGEGIKPHHFKRLTDDEQNTMTHFVKRSSVMGKQRSSYKPDKDLLTIKLGEIDAGNDSAELREEAVKLAEKLYRAGILLRSEFEQVQKETE